MKSFLFALRLRVIRTAVNHANVQTQQPCRQPREIAPTMRDAPRRTIIHQHRFRHSVTTEYVFQVIFNCCPLLITASFQHQRKTRVVVEDRQRMTPMTVGHLEFTFVVHLPKIVRLWMLEALNRLVL